jgi:hypothetical protein
LGEVANIDLCAIFFQCIGHIERQFDGHIELEQLYRQI